MSNKKKFGFALGVAIGTAVAAYQAVSQYTHEMIFRSNLKKNELDAYNAELITLTNKKELTLCGHLINRNSHSTMIMIHDINEDATSLQEELDYFLEAIDSNILVLDLVACGMSDGYHKGLVYEDSIDVSMWYYYLLKKFGENHSIILYGKGLGANTALTLGSLDKLNQIKCIISDAGSTSVEDYLTYQCLKQTMIPSIVSKPIIRMIVKNELGINLRKGKTINIIKNNKVPTLFIHSKLNKEVAMDNVFALYNANGGEKELLPLKDYSFYTMDQDDDYASLLVDFINEHK